MSYEEKMIVAVAAKLLRKKILSQKKYLPDDNSLKKYVDFVLKKLKEQYKELKYVRIKSPSGLITPIVSKIVENMKI